jgi:hypothetical protein
MLHPLRMPTTSDPLTTLSNLTIWKPNLTNETFYNFAKYGIPDTGVPTIFPSIKKAILSNLNYFLGSTCKVKSNVFWDVMSYTMLVSQADGEVTPCVLAAYQHCDKNLSF